MARRNTPSKANGNAGPHNRTIVNGGPDCVGPNGHAPASTERGGIPPRGQAASDDASGGTDARVVSSATAPGTVRKACAEAAPPHPTGALYKAVSKRRASGKESPPIPGGEFPLPLNPGEFVEEIHRNTDLFIAWQRLLNSKDEKIRQRAVEKLTEMRYKGATALADEPRRIIIDMPEPNRD